jgi:putative transposase
MSAPAFRLEKGDLLSIEGRLHEIVSRGPSGLLLRMIGGSLAERSFAWDDLKTLYFQGKLAIERRTAPSLPKAVAKNVGRMLDTFRKGEQEVAVLRLEYVTLCDRYFATRRAPKTPSGYERVGRVCAWLRRRRRASEQGVSARRVPLEDFGGTTVRNWHWRWTRSGRSPAALVALHGMRGKKIESFPQFVTDVMRETLEERYLTLERPPLTLVAELIQARIKAYNDANGADMPIPCGMTVRRFLHRNWSEFDTVARREGADAAEQKFRHARKGERPVRPLQVVEVDHHKLDVMVLPADGDRTKAKRAWLSLGICGATRMIVGFHIGFEAPSWTSVMHVLRMAVLDKGPVLDGHDLSTAWPVFGVPEIVKVDNGLEFHSNSIKAAAGHLGFELRYTLPRMPHLKGKVERFFGEVARNFVATTPGRTFRDVRERGRYPSEDLAWMTLVHLREMFLVWAVDYHHNKPHAGLLGRTPLQAWNDLTRACDVRLPPHVGDLDALVGLVIERTVSNQGVRYAGLDYQSPELQAMRRKSGHMGRKWMVKVDPLDVGRVFVLDEERGAWIIVPSTDPGLTDGLDLASWKKIVDGARSGTEPGRNVSRDALLKARARLDAMAGRGSVGRRANIPAIDDWMRNLDEQAFDDIRPDPAGPEDGSRRRRRSKRGPQGDGDPVSASRGHETHEPAPKPEPSAAARQASSGSTDTAHTADPSTPPVAPVADRARDRRDPRDPANWSVE